MKIIKRFALFVNYFYIYLFNLQAKKSWQNQIYKTVYCTTVSQFRYTFVLYKIKNKCMNIVYSLVIWLFISMIILLRGSKQLIDRDNNASSTILYSSSYYYENYLAKTRMKFYGRYTICRYILLSRIVYCFVI